MAADLHPLAPHQLPSFITAPGETDVLMVVSAVILLLAVLGIGLIFLRLHTLPERMAHKSQKLQFEIVAVLGLLALFTHVHLFWVAGLLLALIDIPDFTGLFGRMAHALERIAGMTSPPERPQASQPRLIGRRTDMLELLVCSLLTLLPDYLYRRYGQGKRLGKEITFYSVWFELRWGIISCLMLTIGLITVIFYNHPSTTNAAVMFRTVPIVPETNGRVAQVNLGVSGAVAKGDILFRLDSSKQEAAVEAARRKIAEVEASIVVARAEIVTDESRILEAKSAHQQALDELETKQELQRRNTDIVARREIERLQNLAAGREAALAAVVSGKSAAETRISTLLPAEKASAEAALAQAQTDLDKTVVRAGVSGRVEQFTLRVGDIVNPFMRPAGVLIPEEAGRNVLQAGFSQIEGQVMKVGMVAEVTCLSKPWVVIPMVVTGVQDFIAAGQVRAGEQLVDVQQVAKPGTLLAFLEPLYPDGLDGVTPGSSCIANAYSSNHELIESGKLSTGRKIVLHAVDAVGLVHALLLRIQALVLPIQTLVFSGH